MSKKLLTEFFDQYRDLEKVYQEEYVEAVRSGDTKKANRLLKDQEQRFSGLGNWNETIDTAFEIQNTKGGGWSNEFMKNKNNPTQKPMHIVQLAI